MINKKWANDKVFDDIFLIVNGSFVHNITNNMLGAYIAMPKDDELELLIFANELTNATYKELLNEDILPQIEDHTSSYGIQKVTCHEFLVQSIINERDNIFPKLNYYWCIFHKYEGS
ncbi:hypothetical protein WAF17_03870 [Bernardetia sp. ABR2-2B]|uniref:hypothetical protein n=1 Tax=Bernardetia sp. ABR2-2B TaxID=3127472 RepID=UPI0030D40184